MLALLEALRQGVGARSVGLFDDDRADEEAHQAVLDFRDVFEDGACAHLDWQGWYRTLKSDGRAEGTCTCPGQHRLSGFLIHRRWALLLVSLVATSQGAPVIASSLRALADALPPARNPDDVPPEIRERLEEDAPGTGDGRAPLFWVRKPPE